MPYSSAKLELLQEWRKAQADLQHYKSLESQLRSEVVSAFSRRKFSREGEGISGTEIISVTSDLVVKINHRVIYDFSADKDEVVTHLVKLADFVPVPIVDRLVSWKPTLVVSEYKKLPANGQNLMRQVLNIREGSKDVSIKEPDVEVRDFLSNIRTKE